MAFTASMEILLRNKDKVLAAARELFSARGFHQAGMAELASVAGLSVGQIYRVFESKNAIIAAIAELEMKRRQQTADRMLSRMTGSALPLAPLFEAFLVEWFESQDDALAFDILAEAQRNPDVAITIEKNGPQFRGALRAVALLINPSLSGLALDAAEEFLFAMLFGMGHRNLTLPAVPVEDAARSATIMIFHGLAALGEDDALRR